MNEKIELITDGLFEIAEELACPGQSYQDMYDNENITCSADAYIYTRKSVENSVETGEWDWAIDFLENYMYDEDWFAVKCEALRVYIIKNFM